ncbi:MAG: helix-turn-helix transcriptional regulator [Acidimicrobiales bacterium]
MRGWPAFAGDRRELERALADGLAWAGAEGMTSVEIGLRHEAVRLGQPPRSHVPAMALLARDEQSPWGRAQAAHVVALAADDGAALAEAGGRFAALGVHLHAAEAYAQAAAAHRRAGATGPAIAARRAGEGQLARCEEADTPALRADDQVGGLTGRELDVAALAAAGRSNQEVAEALGISIRTAETHLQRAFAKLGVHRRRELAAIFGTDPREGSPNPG